MNEYGRVLSLLRPHRVALAALIFFIVVSSALSSVGITAISPLLRILFAENPATELTTHTPQMESQAAPPSAASSTHSLALPKSIDSTRARWQSAIESALYRGTRQQMLWRLCVLLLVLFGAKNLFMFLQEVFRVRLEHRVIYDIRQSLYQAISDLPLGFFSQERTGYLMSRVIIDVDMMRGAIVGVLTQFISNSVMVLLAFTFAALVSWKLLLTTLIIVPPNLLLVGWLSRRLRRGSHLVQEEMGETAAVLQESIAGIRILKAFDVAGRERGRFERSNWAYYRAYVKLKILEAMSSPVSEILGILTAVVIIAFGGRLVLSGQLRPDLLFLFLGVMLWMIGPTKTLIKSNSTLQQSLAAASRVFEILDAPKEGARDAKVNGQQRRLEQKPHYDLHFDQVSFAYRSGEPVLRDINLEIAAGTAVALVGPSGAGKSTLVDLVPRFYEPSAGCVRLDGIDLRELDLRELRSRIGIVSQEVILFHDTVRNNIAFGATADDGNVEDAARVANAHDFIQELPLGYDTVIGERGLQLSGGQRQRLAIARAVLKDPPLLILDEATSALDSASEREVQEAMTRLMRGRTSLVIAHRLSTVQDCDRIVVVERGRIVEEGTHTELLARGGAYRQLHDLQFREEPR